MFVRIADTADAAFGSIVWEGEMPLKVGSSQAAVSKKIKTEMAHAEKQDQEVAIAMRAARKLRLMAALIMWPKK